MEQEGWGSEEPKLIEDHIEKALLSSSLSAEPDKAIQKNLLQVAEPEIERPEVEV
jgi:hypothetical protein